MGLWLSASANAVVSTAGPYEVETQLAAWMDTSRDREVPYKAYIPKGLDGPAPVLVFSHGYGGSREAATYLGEHMASHGFVSFHLQHPGSDSSIWQGSRNPLRTIAQTPITAEMTLNRFADLPFALDQIAAANRQGPWAGLLDVDTLGMWGHSFGGVSTMAAAGQRFQGGYNPEPRLRAAAVFSPNAPRGISAQSAYADITIPMLYVSGTQDVVAAFRQTVAHRRVAFEHSVNATRYLFMADGANHSAFSGTRQQEPAANAQAREAVKALGLAFWRAHLQADAEAQQWLRQAAAGVVSGEFEVCEIERQSAPSSARLNADQAVRLRQPLLEAIQRGELSGGSLLVQLRGETVFEESHGVADLDSGRAFSTDEVAMIASSTKPLTGAVFAMLHVRGVLSLDEPLDVYLPQWGEAKLEDGSAVRAPTLRELLSHTSGMPSPQAWGGVIRALLAEHDAPANADLSAHMLKRGLAFAPGTEYQYGGVGMSVAAHAAEVAWQRQYDETLTYAQIMRRLLLDPLEMHNTTFYPSVEVIAGMPMRYRRGQQGLEPIPKPQPQPPGTMANAGGGLVSTAADLVAFYEMVRRGGLGPNGRVMEPEAIALMSDRQVGALGFNLPYADYGYGLGAMLGFAADGALIHLGHGGAFGTDAHLRLDQQRVVVLIVQTPGAQLRRFQAELRAALDKVFVPENLLD